MLDSFKYGLFLNSLSSINIRIAVIPFSLVVLLFSCSKKVDVKNKELGFYFWNTLYKCNQAQLSYLNETNATLLYVRVFDLDTLSNNGIEPVPVSILRLRDSFPSNLKIVPVVYFTRQAIKAIKNVDSVSLKIANLLQKICAEYNFQYEEIQWDYDWTPSTKHVYFDLLQKLKRQDEFKTKKFSATIRLHQVKHRSVAGIPPVDKGLLMCYNMGNLKSYEVENSILSLELMKDYLASMQNYPLTLDVAFPLFSWALHFRGDKFQSILREVDSLEQDVNLEKISDTKYRVKSQMKYKGYTFWPNDIIRIEKVSLNMLKQAFKEVHSHNNNDSISILFFNLDDKIINQYPSYEIQKLFNSY